MKRLEHHIPYQKVSDFSELPEIDRELIQQASQACQFSYAPYSGFHVGAAALLDDDTVVTASNQESEVFPSGMCAERILLYKIQDGFPNRKIISVAITARQMDKPVYKEVNPCGGCAQVFLDTEKRQAAPIRIIMAGAESCTIIGTSFSLLPFAFEFTQTK